MSQNQHDGRHNQHGKEQSRKEVEEQNAVERQQVERLRQLVYEWSENLGGPLGFDGTDWKEMEIIVDHLCRITKCTLYDNFLDGLEYSGSEPEDKYTCEHGRVIIELCVWLKALIVDGFYPDNQSPFRRAWLKEEGPYHCLIEYIDKIKDELIKKAKARLDLIARLQGSVEELGEEEVKFVCESHGKRRLSGGSAGPAEQRRRLSSLFGSD